MRPALSARASAFICWRCYAVQRGLNVLESPASNVLLAKVVGRTQQPQYTFSRTLRVTPNLSKKKDSRGSKHESPLAKVATASAHSQDDPFDYSELEASIVKAHEKLKGDLSKLRVGGKFNPELIENLKVLLDKSSGQKARVADLAQCVPRGRLLNVIAGEKTHIKAIASAIQSSDLSLTPQQDPQNPLQLIIQLPPPTAQSRQRTVEDAVKLGEATNVNIKNARAAQQKRLRAMQIAKSVRPDDLKKAGDRMEKIVLEASKEAKRILDDAKKNLENN